MSGALKFAEDGLDQLEGFVELFARLSAGKDNFATAKD